MPARSVPAALRPRAPLSDTATLLLLVNALGPSSDPPQVGAHPIHALMVCNTPESLAVSMMLYEHVPKLLTAVHSHTGGPFGGESSLHIAVVNRHEDLLIRMVSSDGGGSRGGHGD